VTSTPAHNFPDKLSLGLHMAAVLLFCYVALPTSTYADQASSSTPATVSPTDRAPSTSSSPTRNSKHTSPKKKVIHEGSTTEPTAQLAPGMTPQQAAQQRQTTEDLLTSTEANLQKLSGRNLDQNQQSTIDQVRDFMKQARAANEASDFTRARNLAFKAQLLSEDLIRH